MRCLFFLFFLLARPALGCEIALLLAVDVSGSVDREEYAIQMTGLAEGLRDGTVSEALVAGQAWLTVVQWTGSSRQGVAVPWAEIDSFEALEAFASRVETAPRQWRNFATAIGEALLFSVDQFATIPPCRRRVIDISGDGSSNEGIPPPRVHGLLKELGITVNALVIEGAEPNMTEYFWENVITGPGAFVFTANSYDDYPLRMRQKLLREVAKQLSRHEAANGPVLR